MWLSSITTPTPTRIKVHGRAEHEKPCVPQRKKRAARAPGKRQIKVVPKEQIADFAGLPDDEEDKDYEGNFGSSEEEDGSDDDDINGDKGSKDGSDDDDDDDSSENSSSSDDDVDEENVNDDDAVGEKNEQKADDTTGPATTSSTTATSPHKGVDLSPAALICSLCLNLGRQADGSWLPEVVQCDKCGLVVHEACYGLTEAESVASGASSDTTEPWFCEPCIAHLNEEPFCELCPQRGGPMKRMDSGRWVHLLCALYTPKVVFADYDLLSAVSVFEMPYKEFGQRPCALCPNSLVGRTGVATKCEAGMCKHAYHISCAQRQGLLVDDTWESVHQPSDIAAVDQRYILCPQHANKDDMKMKRKRFSVMFRQRIAVRSNKRARQTQLTARELAKLSHKQWAFDTRFKNLKLWRPSQEQKWPRAVQNSPLFLHKMQRKAQLLGIERDDFEREFKGKFTSDMVGKLSMPPAFTPEFVTYVGQREKYIPDAEKRIAALKLSTERLRETQETVENQFKKAQESFKAAEEDAEDSFVQLLELTGLLKELGCPSAQILPRRVHHEYDDDDDGSDGDGDGDLPELLFTADEPLSKNIKISSSPAAAAAAAPTRKDSTTPTMKVQAGTAVSSAAGKGKKQGSHKISQKSTVSSSGSTVSLNCQSQIGVGNDSDKLSSRSATAAASTAPKPKDIIIHTCGKCDQRKDQHLLTLCDTCHKHYHLSCLDPPLTKMPKKSAQYGWECSYCYFDEGSSSNDDDGGRGKGMGDDNSVRGKKNVEASSSPAIDLDAPRSMRTHMERKPVIRLDNDPTIIFANLKQQQAKRRRTLINNAAANHNNHNSKASTSTTNNNHHNASTKTSKTVGNNNNNNNSNNKRKHSKVIANGKTTTIAEQQQSKSPDRKKRRITPNDSSAAAAAPELEQEEDEEDEEEESDDDGIPPVLQIADDIDEVDDADFENSLLSSSPIKKKESLKEEKEAAEDNDEKVQTESLPAFTANNSNNDKNEPAKSSSTKTISKPKQPKVRTSTTSATTTPSTSTPVKSATDSKTPTSSSSSSTAYSNKNKNAACGNVQKSGVNDNKKSSPAPDTDSRTEQSSLLKNESKESFSTATATAANGDVIGAVGEGSPLKIVETPPEEGAMVDVKTSKDIHRRMQYPLECLNSAVTAVLDRKMGTKKAAKIFNVPRSTISRRVNTILNNQCERPALSSCTPDMAEVVAAAVQAGRGRRKPKPSNNNNNSLNQSNGSSSAGADSFSSSSAFLHLNDTGLEESFVEESEDGRGGKINNNNSINNSNNEDDQGSPEMASGSSSILPPRYPLLAAAAKRGGGSSDPAQATKKSKGNSNRNKKLLSIDEKLREEIASLVGGDTEEQEKQAPADNGNPLPTSPAAAAKTSGSKKWTTQNGLKKTNSGVAEHVSKEPKSSIANSEQQQQNKSRNGDPPTESSASPSTSSPSKTKSKNVKLIRVEDLDL